MIGSGNHARTYLFRNAEGNLVEMPVSWYSEKGGYWAMSPGYDRANQEDFRRTIVNECFSCHNSYPQSAQAEAQTKTSNFTVPRLAIKSRKASIASAVTDRGAPTLTPRVPAKPRRRRFAG